MRHFALLTILSLAVAGCKDEPEAEATRGAESVPVGMPAGHPPTGGGGAALPDLPSGNISGTLQASPEVADKIAAGDVVFVMAKNAVTGSLLAVSRVQVDSLPAKFSLAGGSAMHADSSLAGKVKLEARVDKDGDAMTKNPGDVVGEVDGLVAVPAEDIVLILNKTL